MRAAPQRRILPSFAAADNFIPNSPPTKQTPRPQFQYRTSSFPTKFVSRPFLAYDFYQYNTEDLHAVSSLATSAPKLSNRIFGPPSKSLIVGAAPTFPSSRRKLRSNHRYSSGSETLDNKRLSKTSEVPNLLENQTQSEAGLADRIISSTTV